ncbi:hypothetical protein [Marinomonas sp. IMCC 4694]|uniref:hypothetical protein n=1 Tax=Marinomonas sp. IMCC 4694 TaxID=2605432 RepID=UPI0011E74569|nr:hypothetical protein [Marinomonas sp. IMCC 4694]TYL48212.1 hypothetical protein FXV75_09835 [Marinomonas sp. IMCC 4694]
MKYALGLVVAMPLLVHAQTVELHSVDIIYGNQIIRSQHQVVLSSPEDVAVIPAERSVTVRGPNVVVTADGSTPYLEEGNIAQREQLIFDEVNKRTDDAPFTVLFTGKIPADIEEKRIRMMPEVGIFAERPMLDEVPSSESMLSDVVSADATKSPIIEPKIGDFAPIGTGVTPVNSQPASEAPVTNEERLEKLIGG